MTEEQKTSLIERYLKGELPDAERQEVTRRAETDVQFAEEIVHMRLVLETLNDRDLVRFHRDITAMWDEKPGEDEKGAPEPDGGPPAADSPTGGSRRIWLLAAVLLVAGTVATGVWQYYRADTPETAVEKENTPAGTTPVSPPETSPESETPVKQPEEKKPDNPQPAPRPIAMAREYYGTPPTFSNLRKGPDDVPGGPLTPLQQAERAFAAQEYNKAVQLLANPDPGVMEIALYLRGHAHFNAGNYQNAARDFQAVVERKGLDLDNAQWYLLLSNLAFHGPQSEKVRRQLDEIAGDPEHTFYDQAKKLQASINR